MSTEDLNTFNVVGDLPTRCPRTGCGGKVFDVTTPPQDGERQRGKCFVCQSYIFATRPEVRPARAARATYRFEAWVSGELPKLCPLEPLCAGDVEPNGTLTPGGAWQGTCRKCGTRVFVERRHAPTVVWAALKVPRS
jgi:hypothetical protein